MARTHQNSVGLAQHKQLEDNMRLIIAAIAMVSIAGLLGLLIAIVSDSDHKEDK